MYQHYTEKFFAISKRNLYREKNAIFKRKKNNIYQKLSKEKSFLKYPKKLIFQKNF